MSILGRWIFARINYSHRNKKKDDENQSIFRIVFVLIIVSFVSLFDIFGFVIKWLREYINKKNALIILCLLWLALSVGKVNQSLPCDWLPVRAKWHYLDYPLCSKKKCSLSHTINPLLTNLARSTLLDIGLLHSLACLWITQKLITNLWAYTTYHIL